MREIRDAIVGLTESPLYGYRVSEKNLPVIGEGDHYAKIMFVGEAPGKNEAETGRPFCGAAGKILTEALEKVGIKREEVYITNVVKDRPPDNRDPLPEEIECYSPFLDRQIDIIQPRIIATLGRFSMDYSMRKFGRSTDISTISKMHGQEFEVEAPFGSLTIIPMFHPAATIYNRTTREDFFKDFELLKKYLV